MFPGSTQDITVKKRDILVQELSGYYGTNGQTNILLLIYKDQNTYSKNEGEKEGGNVDIYKLQEC